MKSIVNNIYAVKLKLSGIVWANRISFSLCKKRLVSWYLLNILLAVLPTVNLALTQNIVQILSVYYSTLSFDLSRLALLIFTLAINTLLFEIGNIVTSDLAFLEMYDSLYGGIQSLLIDAAQAVDISVRYNESRRNKYISTVLRASTLNEYIVLQGNTIKTILSIISLMLYTLYINKYIGLIYCMYVSVIIAFTLLFPQSIPWEADAIRAADTRATYYAHLGEDIHVAKEIRIYQLQYLIADQWLLSHNVIANAEKKYNAAGEKRSLFSGIVFNILHGSLCAFFVILSLRNSVMVDGLIVLTIMGAQSYSLIPLLVHQFTKLSFYLNFILEQKALINRPTDKPNPSYIHATPSVTEPIFSVKSLRFAYGQTNVVKIDNLTIESGKFYVLVGENGSGKSTLIALLLGILQPQKGKLLYKGTEYDNYVIDELQKNTAVYFQDLVLFHKTILENIGFGNLPLIDHIDQIKESLDSVNLLERVSAFPHGMYSIIGKQADKSGIVLSKGESQKIGIARVLFADRDVVIMDEPTAGLDPLSEINQLNNFRSKFHGKTIIMITQRLGLAQYADKVLVMAQGKIVGSGTHAELMLHNSIYQHMYNSQAKWYS